MFVKDTYKPITLTYNLGLPMLWRHPEHVDIERTKVVRYCAAVSAIYFYSDVNPKILNLKNRFMQWDKLVLTSSCIGFSGFKAMEVYWAGGEHGEGGYKDVGEEVVGYIQWWELGLRELICVGCLNSVYAFMSFDFSTWFGLNPGWSDGVFDFYFFVVDWSLLCLWMLDEINDATTPLGFYWLSCLKFWDRDRMGNQFYFLKLFFPRENNYFPNLKSLETIKTLRRNYTKVIYSMFCVRFRGSNKTLS